MQALRMPNNRPLGNSHYLSARGLEDFFFFFFFLGGGGHELKLGPVWGGGGSKYYFVLCWGPLNQISEFSGG